MKLFITGGAGLIGQAIAKEHSARGYTVAIWDNHSNAFIQYAGVEGCHAYHPSIPLYEALQEFQPDVISHQAAFVSVGDSQINPSKYHRNNTGVTADLMQCIIDGACEPKLIMHAGSMGPYGEGRRMCMECGHVWYITHPRKDVDPVCQRCGGDSTRPIPMHEDQELHPVSQYGESKRTQEEMLRLFCYTYDIPVTSLRYFSVYGTKCNPNNPHTGVLSIIAHKLINEPEVVLNEDGRQSRDLIHCEDVARAHAKMVDLSLGVPGFDTINVGTGIGTSISDVAIAMANEMGMSDKTIRFTNRVRIGDVKDCRASVRKLRMVDWAPGHNVMQDIYDYVRWLKENMDLFTHSHTSLEAERALQAKGVLQ